jgi:hypothetical protein
MWFISRHRRSSCFEEHHLLKCFAPLRESAPKLLLVFIPGEANKDLSAAQANVLLATVQSAGSECAGWAHVAAVTRHPGRVSGVAGAGRRGARGYG